MRIVVKFGGTSLGSIAYIRKAAAVVKALKEETEAEIIVVASAMATATTSLIEYTSYFYEVNNAKEYDTVVSSGEQVSAGLLALALEEKGLLAKSLLSWQVPIITNNNYANAQIEKIGLTKINSLLNKKIIPVIAGFQGITGSNDITTLGRGGTDTTAAAVAGALKADCCYIYTDVEGVYAADPNLISYAKKFDNINSDLMIEMANSGAKVLHTRSIELAYKNNIKLYVKSTFSKDKNAGTKIMNKSSSTSMESPLLSGIVSSTNEVLFKILGLSNQQDGILLNEILKSGITLDMLVEEKIEKSSNLSFVVARDNLEHTLKIINSLKEKLNYQEMLYNTEIAKISLVGVGLQTHPVIMQKLFHIVHTNQINILLLSLANLKISAIIEDKQLKNLINLLYKEYEEYFEVGSTN